MSDDVVCDFVSGPCPNKKKCVYPRCQIEYSGSALWAALKRVVTYVEGTEPQIKLQSKPKQDAILPDDSFD
jgi:hypothetical protein